MTIGQPSATASMNLEFGRSLACVNVSFDDGGVGSISNTQVELPSALNSALHSLRQLSTRRCGATLSRISPESMRWPFAYIFHAEPTFQSLSTFMPKRYCAMISR